MSVIPFYFFDGSQTHCASFVDLYMEQLHIALGTQDTTLFTTERRKTAINNAMYAWVRQTQSTKREQEIPIQTGVGEYSLETNLPDFMELSGEPYVKVVSATRTRYIQGEDLPRRETNWLNRVEPGWRGATASTPTSWYVTDNVTQHVGLTPAPSPAAGEVWTLVVPYLASPVRMTVDTESPFTVSGLVLKRLCPWGWSLPLHAAAQLEPLRKNYEAVTDLTNKWNAAIAQYLSRTRTLGPGQISLRNDYYKSTLRTDAKDPRRWP